MADTDNDTSYVIMCFVEMFASETKTYYCNASTYFVACTQRDKNDGWVIVKYRLL